MSAAEHAEKIHHTLKAVERALRRHHRALEAALVELGPTAGLTEGEIIALGGGTPKTPPDEAQAPIDSDHFGCGICSQMRRSTGAIL